MKRRTLITSFLSLLTTTPAGTTPQKKTTGHRTPYADRIGVELDGLGDGARIMPFIDLAKTLRPFTLPDSAQPAPTDNNGWPTADCQTVLFDIRPIPAWDPPIDDPEAFQPDWSGTYKLSFNGQATLTLKDPNGIQIRNQKYDPDTNRTSADILVPPTAGILLLAFSRTRRSPRHPENSGITNLRVTRPGYPHNTTQTFTNEFLNALKPFRILRYMDWLETNHNPGYYGDPGHHALHWKDRRLPTDATQVPTGNKYGVAWEYCIQLANLTDTHMWINIPVAATDDYVLQLARMLKNNLKPQLRIYIEHSNEVWNFGFPQYTYNKLAAIDEVRKGNSPLNNDNINDEERFAHRRHAQRLIQITRTFQNVFGTRSLLTRIRPVYASWLIQPQSHYRDVLTWVENTYGHPGKFFYALASAAYFNAQTAPPDASPQQILQAMRQSTQESLQYHRQIKAIADHYRIKYAQYEIGPDTGGGSTVNVANRIRANRLPEIKDVILENARLWFQMGGDAYIYFALAGPYSRYGCWGLSEDIRNLHTPKWQAIYQLTGYPPPPRRKP
ncbi:MAG: hypothetical protein RMJ43_03900 [Chloroherpetonaceae bacterium]|nr:hypothetical protein [Chloroherpetonaceae bacterium]